MEFTCHRDFSVIHLNCEKPHAYFIPYESAGKALADERENAAAFRSLCGEWAFRFYPHEGALPDFLAPDFTTEGFDTLTVPRSWQTVLDKGYDAPQYVCHGYQMPIDPPHVPAEDPCGLYVREITLEAPAEGKRVYACFEGVDSCFYLYINDRFAGYSEVSHATAEIEVTPYLRAGRNTVKVLVFKFSVGSYLEDQDKIRLSGIFRECYLLTRDAEHLTDAYLRTSLEKGYGSATLAPQLTAAAPLPLSYELLSPSGETIAKGNAKTDTVPPLTVNAPLLWSDETPYLYTYLLHIGTEYIAFRFGFRDLYIRRKTVFLNGKKIKAKGVNRHDTDPVTGAAVTFAQMRRDLDICRANHINMIRTSHYPNDPRFPALCDAYGIYLCDEADLETHGFNSFGDWDRLSDDPAWESHYVDRARLLFERDKNHPCVLLWSLGNESGAGVNFRAMHDYLKSRDPACLVHYEGASFRYYHYKIKQKEYVRYKPFDALSATDVFSRMYPAPDSCEKNLKDRRIRQPLFLCEYSHAMGNSNGDLKAYWDLIYAHDNFFGGCVWEFCDHSVVGGEDPVHGAHYLYAGDLLPATTLHGNYCFDGLNYPDRRPHTGLAEYKEAIKPFAVTDMDFTTGKFRVRNRRRFRDLSDCALEWRFEREGELLRAGRVEEVRVTPRAARTYRADLSGIDLTEGGALTVTLVWREEMGFAHAGDPLGFEQFVKEKETAAKTSALPVGATPTVCRSGDLVTVTAGERAYTFDSRAGLLVSARRGDAERLTAPLTPTVWRAPLDNDMQILPEWKNAGFDIARVDCRSFREEETAAGSVAFTAELVLGAILRRPFLTVTVRYTVSEAGIAVAATAHRLSYSYRKETPYLPRFGFTFSLPAPYEYLRWCGRGPGECYHDKRLATREGVFSKTVTENFEHYLRPQENSAHCDTSYFTVATETGETFAAFAEGERFSFNCSHYTAKRLTEARHDFDLTPTDATVVHIDCRQSGVGSASCGYALTESERMNADTYTLSFRLLP